MPKPNTESEATETQQPGATKQPETQPEQPAQARESITSEWSVRRVEHSKHDKADIAHLRLAGSQTGHAIDLNIEDPKSFGKLKAGDRVRMTLQVL